MRPGELLLFRYRGDLLIGRCQSSTAGRVKAAIGRNRVFEVPIDRVLYATGLVAEDKETLERFRLAVEAGAESLDLRETWELLKDDQVGYGFRDIAELSWSSGMTPEHYGATLLALARGCPYFAEHDALYVPLSEEQVEANLTRIERQQSNQEESEAFIAWARGDDPGIPAAFTTRQRHWVDRLQQYAIHGDAYDQSGVAKDLLARVKESSGGDLQRYAFELIARKGMWDEDEPLDLIRYNVPVEFDDEAIQQAATAHPDEDGREDLTGVPVLSIDDEDTMDVDDALSIEETPDGYRIGVHIADVSAVIPKDSPLDRTARQRMSSLYLPDQKVPMLPPDLSEERCSLLQGTRRLAVSFFYEVDRTFTFLSTRIVPSILSNQAKLSYEEVDRLLDDPAHPFAGMLRTMNAAAEVYRARRIEDGAIELDRMECRVIVDEQKRMTIARREGHSRADRIVSELMILTNVMAARFCAEHRLPSIYRTQERVELKGLDDDAHEAVRRYLILRQLRPSDLNLDPKPHAMLGVDAYCQVTSPIRRYIDLVLQRQLTAYLRSGQPCYSRDHLADLLSRAEERGKELGRIEARREWYWLLKYLGQSPGQVLRAVVLEIRDRDVLVELLDYRVRVSMRLTTQAEPGKEIAVRVTLADAWDGILRLVQVGEEQ
ncbi:MAG: RNB domain-containing ribonuclease [Candidatus Latescibacteria bacterium]|nr:RNB domain-containing ribonuclease [Candidatus Latescibacterota bacterium]